MRYLNAHIGFVGLGNMGMKMVQNLVKKGESLVVFDTQPEVLSSLKNSSKVTIAETVSDLAKHTSHIITMLPNNDSVWGVYTNPDGILKNCTKENATFIDCSTVDPILAQKIWQLSQEKNHSFFDAPVSGGVVGAEAGTLTFMVGGSETIPKDVESLLLKMGARVISCGKSGTGQAAKLCNNMLLGATMVALAETMNMGIKFGLDAKVLASIINSSSGRCWSSDVNQPVPNILETAPSTRNYQGGFKTNLLIKDMKLALALAEKTGSSVTLAKRALEIYNSAANEQQIGELDFSAIYKVISNLENES
ncbi:hypothetical protein V9T40_005308 [Parthenolecanium corni]|uniref:3-hydroxyisobutyrate dehydrogenase n=1 Tax=Parthenolecanium corni TaxID=536013 RepID=A0AAN9TDX5_9HEMI